MIRETDLFSPLRDYLTGQNYRVHSEVKGCDLVARKGEELIIVEMKTKISINLLAQALQRKEMSESVYIAVPVPPGKSSPPNFKRVKALLHKLELGCIFVDFLKTKTKVRVVLHPREYRQRKSPSSRRAIIREIDGRYAEFNRAGEVAGREKITAYKQEALRIAELLSRRGSASPADLRALGSSEKTQTILSRNVYGWFDRVQRGLYRLHPEGEKALWHYRDQLQTILKASRRERL